LKGMWLQTLDAVKDKFTHRCLVSTTEADKSVQNQLSPEP
jgi:hypothetical protein